MDISFSKNDLEKFKRNSNKYWLTLEHKPEQNKLKFGRFVHLNI